MKLLKRQFCKATYPKTVKQAQCSVKREDGNNVDSNRKDTKPFTIPLALEKKAPNIPLSIQDSAQRFSSSMTSVNPSFC